MQYTPTEQECLDLMNRTNFKAPSKDEIVSLVSKLHQMRPEVAQEIIKQFPEFVSLIRTSMTEYKGMLEDIIESDDKTTDHVFETINHDLDNARESRVDFNAMASTVLADLSKSLDNPDLSPEERKDIFDREERILKMAGEKDVYAAPRTAPARGANRALPDFEPHLAGAKPHPKQEPVRIHQQAPFRRISPELDQSSG